MARYLQESAHSRRSVGRAKLHATYVRVRHVVEGVRAVLLACLPCLRAPVVPPAEQTADLLELLVSSRRLRSVCGGCHAA